MMLKQSIAATISFGPFVDKTDGVTPEVGLVSALDHATTGIKLSTNGGELTIRHATVTATTYDDYGNYIVTLDTTDTGTLGSLRVQFIETATCLPVWADFEIVTANIWDSYHSTDILDVSVTQLGGVAQSLTDLKDFADAGYDPGTNKVTGVVLCDTTTTNTDMRGTDSANTTTPLTAAEVNAEVDTALNTAIPGTPTADSINQRIKAIDVLSEANGDGDLAAIATVVSLVLIDTDEIGTAGVKLTNLGGMSTAMKAQVNAEADTAATAYGALKPTTGGRTLDVTTGGAAGIDWGNVENKTTVNDLSATDIQLCDTVTTNTDMRGTDSAALASVCTEVRLAALTDWINGGRLDLILDIIAADVVNIDGSAMRGTDSANTTTPLTAAQVNAQVVDVLKTDTIAQLSVAAPPGAPTFEEAIMYVYQYLRNNREQTATKITMFADDGTTAICNSTISDNGTTAVKGEFGSGA